MALLLQSKEFHFDVERRPSSAGSVSVRDAAGYVVECGFQLKTRIMVGKVISRRNAARRRCKSCLVAVACGRSACAPVQPPVSFRFPVRSPALACARRKMRSNSEIRLQIAQLLTARRLAESAQLTINDVQSVSCERTHHLRMVNFNAIPYKYAIAKINASRSAGKGPMVRGLPSPFSILIRGAPGSSTVLTSTE